MSKILKACLTLSLIALLHLAAGLNASAKDEPLAAWQPKFDPAQAEYTYLLSNIAHPGIAGIGVGYKIRDAVWEKSGGRLYVDFRPLAQLGGEKDVINKLKIGAVNGMLCSSVAAANVSSKLGLVNLPHLPDRTGAGQRRHLQGLESQIHRSALARCASGPANRGYYRTGSHADRL